MSRPCFALSVMLCCMAGPLLIIGKTHAQDTVVSPSHDPGKCIVCPLAYGPLDICGGYSDYDYHNYWYEDDLPPAPEAAAEAASGLDVVQPQIDGSTEAPWESNYDDYYADYVYGDGYESIAPRNADAAPVVDAAQEQAATDYEAYEDEWFSYGSDTTIELRELESAERLETGYDEAFDEAMSIDLQVAEPVADNLPADSNAQIPDVQSAEADDYESFYKAYDDLYNFESTPASSESEAIEATVEPAVDEHARQTTHCDPAWLTELVNRMLAPVWTATDGIALNSPALNRDSQATMPVDGCAQEWDCESDYWANPRYWEQPSCEQPSVVLSAADALDGMAAVLQNAAELLRGVAGGSLAETAQSVEARSPR